MGRTTATDRSHDSAYQLTLAGWRGLLGFPRILGAERKKSQLTHQELAAHLGLDAGTVEAELFGWPIPRLIVEEGLRH